MFFIFKYNSQKEQRTLKEFEDFSGQIVAVKYNYNQAIDAFEKFKNKLVENDELYMLELPVLLSTKKSENSGERNVCKHTTT